MDLEELADLDPGDPAITHRIRSIEKKYRTQERLSRTTRPGTKTSPAPTKAFEKPSTHQGVSRDGGEGVGS